MQVKIWHSHVGLRRKLKEQMKKHLSRICCALSNLLSSPKIVLYVIVSTDILGNANVSLFFSCGQNPQLSQQALSAYAQSVSTEH